MKRLLIGLLIFSYVLLAGCASHRYPYLNKNLASESWERFVDVDPSRWAYGSDNWFMTGDPNATEMAANHAPYSAAISTMAVRVPQFINIRSNGDFQVQLYGTFGANTVTVYGPNDAVRAVAIQVRGNTLCLDQLPRPPGSLRRVIIRIGVNQLNNLVQLGCGPIEGIQLHSLNLSILSRGRGNIYLAGNVNLRHVMAVNTGSVTVFGADTPWLDIKTGGRASVNVSGNVGIRSIVHHGVGNINIIGANSCGLRIYAAGRGKIGIRGNVKLQEVKAANATCVYIVGVNSPVIYAWATNSARIGLSGIAENIYVNAAKGSRFEGCRLCATNAFVRAYDWSHINATVTNRLFATATENASVYVYGSPNIVSQFVSGYGVVIPIWTNTNAICPVVNLQPYSYKGENIAAAPPLPPPPQGAATIPAPVVTHKEPIPVFAKDPVLVRHPAPKPMRYSAPVKHMPYQHKKMPKKIFKGQG